MRQVSPLSSGRLLRTRHRCSRGAALKRLDLPRTKIDRERCATILELIGALRLHAELPARRVTLDIGLREVLSLEEQRLIKYLSKRV